MNLFDKLDLRSFWNPPTCCWSGGDSTASSTEKSTADFMKTLQGAFSSQFGQQSAALNFLNGKMTGEINNPEGYSAKTLASMRTTGADIVAQKYQDAVKATQNQQFNQGGQNLPSGVNAQINAGIATAAGRAASDTQNEITQANEDLKQRNFWNATNVLNGVAQEYNPGTYASTANEASNSVTALSQAVTAANGPTWGSVLGGIATGVGGALMTGGMSNLGKGLSFFGSKG